MTLRDYSQVVERIKGKPLNVVDKLGTLVRVDEKFSDLLKEGEEYVPQGIFYSTSPDDLISRRTIFRDNPLKIDGKKYFLELKGYGVNGKDIWFQEHDAKDVYYGMYLENALLEFERLQFARNLGLEVPFPVAVVQIPHEEYLRQGLESFSRGLTGITIEWDFKDEDFLANFGTPFHRFRNSDAILNYLKKSSDPEKKMKEILSLFKSPFKSRPSPESKIKALTSGKEIGYLIRAARCPYRIGGHYEVKNLSLPANKSAVKRTGKTFMRLLENGILHHCPSLGNFTLDGELSDLQDTFDLNTEYEKLEPHMKFVGTKSLREFTEYLIGPIHTSSKLSQDFIDGMYHKGISLEEAVDRTMKIIESYN